MAQTIQNQMTSDDTKKEALDDIDVAEVNERPDRDAEQSSINIKKLIRKVGPIQGHLQHVYYENEANETGGLPTPARAWVIVPVFLPRPNGSCQCKSIVSTQANA